MRALSYILEKNSLVMIGVKQSTSTRKSKITCRIFFPHIQEKKVYRSSLTFLISRESGISNVSARVLFQVALKRVAPADPTNRERAKSLIHIYFFFPVSLSLSLSLGVENTAKKEEGEI